MVDPKQALGGSCMHGGCPQTPSLGSCTHRATRTPNSESGLPLILNEALIPALAKKSISCCDLAHLHKARWSSNADETEQRAGKRRASPCATLGGTIGSPGSKFLLTNTNYQRDRSKYHRNRLRKRGGCTSIARLAFPLLASRFHRHLGPDS